MGPEAQQAHRLDRTLPWATLTHQLRDIWRPEAGRIHLRPSAMGITVVDLSPSRPQLWCGDIASHRTARDRLAQILASPPVAGPLRQTGEKELQSWLIAEAYRNGGVLTHLAPNMHFVTDEQHFAAEPKGFVCDLLAVRRTPSATIPVAIELKDKRLLTRLVQQVTNTAGVVDAQRDRFSHVFSAILGMEVKLDAACERWILWPANGQHAVDPWAGKLAAQGIEVRGYRADRGNFSIVR